MHAGEEGVAAGRAALLGVIVREERAFIADAIDVRRLADHQPAMVDARLIEADVVAHDEEDIGFLPLLGGSRNARHCRGGTHYDKSAPDCSEHAHGCLSSMSAAEARAAAVAHLHPTDRVLALFPYGIVPGAFGRTLRGWQIRRSPLDALCAFGRLRMSLRPLL